MNKKKAMYVSPRMEVIEMVNEGVIAASSGVTTLIIPQQPAIKSSTRSASSSDIEDMLNDILTIEQ